MTKRRKQILFLSLEFRSSIFLVAIGIMDELPMQVLGFLCVKFLAAIRTFKVPCHLDSHVYYGSIAGFCSIANLDFGHVVTAAYPYKLAAMLKVKVLGSAP